MPHQLYHKYATFSGPCEAVLQNLQLILLQSKHFQAKLLANKERQHIDKPCLFTRHRPGRSFSPKEFEEEHSYSQTKEHRRKILSEIEVKVQ